MVVIKTVERKNPQDLLAPPKYYTQAVGDGFVDLERLAFLVSNQCTVREADCLAVLNALQHNVMDELSQGRIVQIGSLGNFQIGVRSEGVDDALTVTSNQVRSAHINYRPGKRLRKMLNTLDYKLIGG